HRAHPLFRALHDPDLLRLVAGDRRFPDRCSAQPGRDLADDLPARRAAAQPSRPPRRDHPDLRAGDRRLHGAPDPRRHQGHHARHRHRGPVHRGVQLAARRGVVLHHAGHRAAHLGAVLSVAAPPPEGGMMAIRAWVRWSGGCYLAAIIAFLYLPILVMMVMAFNRSPLYQVPIVFDTVWFERLAGNEKLLGAAFNSLVIAVANTIVATALGTMTALGFARYRFRGRTLLQLLLFPPI